MFTRGCQNGRQSDSDVEGPMPEPPVRHILIVVENLPVNGGVKFGHCGGAKVGQFGASALERAALI